MVPLRTLIASLLILLFAIPAHGAPKPRPYSGIGLLIIHSFTAQRTADMAGIPIYQAPGVGRFAEIEASELPQLSPVLKSADGKYSVIVLGKQGTWLRIVYDDAGRAGWIHKERYWEFVRWESFLKGREIQLLPGLKKGLYALHKEPSETSPILGTLTRQKNLRVIETEDDWCLVIVDLTVAGWLRWRDEDGRFLIAVDEKFDPQKH
ncbi:MAG: hypothetical protein FD174_1138 [Geobacteraceae bacterium]|nr:MAG: hypothetical protein FD174_1138 [Geobacteraceae bacterium]